MLSQYFGSFLLNRGYVNRDTLNNVLSTEKQSRVKLGVLAVSSGILTAAHVEQIHTIQKTQDKRFGEIAIELNYLTGDKLEALLLQQKSSQMELSQLLVDQGVMDLFTLEKALEEYQRDSKFSDAQFQAIQSGNVEELVEAFINLPGTINRQAYMDYISLFIRNTIRFIDSTPVFKVVEEFTYDANLDVVRQDMKGDVNLNACLAFKEDMYVKFATRFAEMQITEKNELADASVTEFLNLHNGIFVVNQSEQDKKVQLLPPSILKGNELFLPEQSIICSIDTDLGEFQLLLF